MDDTPAAQDSLWEKSGAPHLVEIWDHVNSPTVPCVSYQRKRPTERQREVGYFDFEFSFGGSSSQTNKEYAAREISRSHHG
jgi:hypothetical protein